VFGEVAVAAQEDRVRELEAQVTDLRIDNAGLATSVEHLAGAVKTLTETVQDLRDTMNKGRGALWMAMLLAGGIGAALTTVLKRVFGIL
jgi:uncharacterized coiled-coil protein SlyX